MTSVVDPSNERERLDRLVKDTHALLSRIVERHPRWIPRQVRTELQTAVTDLDSYVQEATRQLTNADDHLISTLEAVGLSGAQLMAKEMIARHALAEFDDSAITIAGKEIVSKKTAEEALEGVDVPLETLGKVLAPVGAVVEVKHGVAWAIKNTGFVRTAARAPVKALKAIGKRLPKRSPGRTPAGV